MLTSDSLGPEDDDPAQSGDDHCGDALSGRHPKGGRHEGHSGDDPELTLSPPEPLGELDPRSPTSRKGALPQPRYLPEPPAEPVRYSLRDLLILVTLSAVLLAPIRLMGAALFAAVSGAMAFAVLVYISLAKPQQGIVHVGWWVLMLIYITASVAALVNRNL